MVEDLLQNKMKIHPQLRLSFIDFYDMAILRPDNHIDHDDCLHWYFPGSPMDAANTVLLHEMEIAAAAAASSTNI